MYTEANQKPEVKASPIAPRVNDEAARMSPLELLGNAADLVATALLFFPPAMAVQTLKEAQADPGLEARAKGVYQLAIDALSI